MKDYYCILGVSYQAESREIKAAYRKLAKQYHPDVVGGDREKQKIMYEIQEAYQVIGDEEKRRAYDRRRARERAWRPTRAKRLGRRSREAPQSRRKCSLSFLDIDKRSDDGQVRAHAKIPAV